MPEAGELKRAGRSGTINDNGGNDESSDDEPLYSERWHTSTRIDRGLLRAVDRGRRPGR
jgi:hypothetical protein